MLFKIKETGELTSIFLSDPKEREDLVEFYLKKFDVSVNESAGCATEMEQFDFDWWASYFRDEQALLMSINKVMNHKDLNYNQFYNEMMFVEIESYDADVAQIHQMETVDYYMDLLGISK